MIQLVQIAGSLLVLFGFLGTQRGWFGQRSRTYLVVNVAGSATLAVVAVLDRQWGFLLLEGVWAIVSAAGLVRGAVADRCRSRSGPGRNRGPAARPRPWPAPGTGRAR